MSAGPNALSPVEGAFDGSPVTILSWTPRHNRVTAPDGP
jgi:hypothetical protein